MTPLSGNNRVDWALLGVLGGILGIGLITLYSATRAGGGNPFHTAFGRQILWLALGVVLFALIQTVPAHVFEFAAYPAYGLSLLLLIAVLFVSKGHVSRWLEWGGVRIQPSEPAKIGTLLILARFLTVETQKGFSVRLFAGSLVMTLIPVFLIAREPDMGTAIVFLALWFGMILWAGIPVRWVLFMFLPPVALVSGIHPWVQIVFLVLLTAGLLLLRQNLYRVAGLVGVSLVIGLFFSRVWRGLEPYQQQRIQIFLGLKSDPHGAAYQVIQSKVAIGSGGFWGKGLLQGSQSQLRFLPEQHTDFIFSVLGEEFGFIGVGLVFILFFWLFMRILYAARSRGQRFGGFLSIGALTILAFQFAVNVGMTVGLMPVTGLPLPFLSYGGSSLLTSLMLVGLVMKMENFR